MKDKEKDEITMRMDEVRVPKTKLLAKLKENRTQHREMFEKALEGYRELIIEVLEKKLSDAKAGKKVDTYINLPMPTDQTKDYDRAIAMIEMDVSKVVTLDATEFSNYVMDDWSWKQQFTLSNSAYFAKVGYAPGANA